MWIIFKNICLPLLKATSSDFNQQKFIQSENLTCQRKLENVQEKL